MGNVLSIFLYKDLSKSSRSSMSKGRVHVTTVETRVNSTGDSNRVW